MFGVVLTLVVCSVVLHSCEAGEPKARSPRIQLCGSALADFLRDTCTFFNKRSSSVELDNYRFIGPTIEDYHELRGLQGVFRSRRSALSPRFSRLRRPRLQGVASQCCYRSCTLDELSSYCAS